VAAVAEEEYERPELKRAERRQVLYRTFREMTQLSQSDKAFPWVECELDTIMESFVGEGAGQLEAPTLGPSGSELAQDGPDTYSPRKGNRLSDHHAERHTASRTAYSTGFSAN
jgi:hypothetical protein